MRWWPRIAIAVLLGLLLNFAAAVSCSLWGSVESTCEWELGDKPKGETPMPIPEAWLVPQSPQTLGIWGKWFQYEGVGVTKWALSVSEQFAGGSGGVAEHGLGYWRAGFPMRTLEGTVLVDTRGGWKAERRWAVEAPSWTLERPGDISGGPTPWVGNFIPLRPLLVGTIVNTALYSVLALGLLLIPRAIRRSSRERRGLCPSCGYPRHGLATNAACPECGSVPHSGHLASAARLRRS